MGVSVVYGHYVAGKLIEKTVMDDAKKEKRMAAAKLLVAHRGDCNLVDDEILNCRNCCFTSGGM